MNQPQTEYWEPESLVAKLVVGARVRVRGFAECPWRNRSNALHGEQSGHGYTCHEERMAGMLGTVLRVDYEGMAGHRFEIMTEREGLGHYAAIELLPVED